MGNIDSSNFSKLLVGRALSKAENGEPLTKQEVELIEREVYSSEEGFE